MFMKRKPLSKKEIKALNLDLVKFGLELNKKDRIDLIDDKYYYFNDDIAFLILDGILVPSLKFILRNNVSMPEAIVDMGAVKFIVNGADVMRPGIQEFEGDFEKNDFVVIKDLNNKKALVLGKALLSKEEMLNQKDGKAFENIHYIGDKIWNLEF